MASPERGAAAGGAATQPSVVGGGPKAPVQATGAQGAAAGLPPGVHPPSLNSALAKDALRRFIHAQVEVAHATGVVIGLSGGIDSAVVAALSVAALGSERVRGLLLPSPHSSEADRVDALALAEWLGVRAETVPLDALVAAWRAAAPEADRAREGNLTARLRMALLYDRSARDGTLVAGTGNKTEILLGYTTLWGDQAAAFTPLGDLYKTQVRELAAFLGVPEAVRRRSPSAGLWAGQTDEQELGAAYETLDALLYRYVDLRHDLDELERGGFDRELAAGIVERVHRNEFKRRPPLVPKLSTRTVGHDFLYPRHWGGPQAAGRTAPSDPDGSQPSSTRGHP